MVIKAILFDADGVIINKPKVFSKQYSEKYGVSTEEMIPFFKKDFQDCLIGKKDLKEIIAPWLQKWNWQGDVNGFLEFWFESENYIDSRIADSIKKLKEKGIKCYMITNQEIYRTRFMKENMGFKRLFDKIFSSAEIGSKKPERRFYDFVLKEINKEGINANEMISFDDDKENVGEGNKIGIKSYLYKTFDDFESIVKSLY